MTAQGAPRRTTPLHNATEPHANRRATAGHDEDWRSLLLPLSRAQDVLTRLETAAATTSEAVRAGLVARLALHEAAVWLARNGIDASVTGLALRDAGLVGAWGIATTLGGGDGSGAPRDDRLTGQALRLAQVWRELADRGGGSPGVGITNHPGAGGAGDFADAKHRDHPGVGTANHPGVGEADHPDQNALRQALATLGGGPLADDTWLGWCALIGEDAADLPVLLRAARVAGRWQHERAAEEGRADLLSAPALFLSAAFWRGRRQDALPLPLWSAPAAMLQALALRGGSAPGWAADLLAVAVAATRQAHAELRRLLAVERRGRALAGSVTARSRLPAAVDAALRFPALNARRLSAHSGISTRAGVALADQLVGAGVLREATGRGAWRAYVLAEEA